MSAHLDRYIGTYEERFEPRYGPLRRVVPRTAEAYLECGRLQNGFARIRCPRCSGEHVLAFSCQTRNFCPSCQAKRAALLGETVAGEVAAPVAHRHVVFTVPKALRGLFERDRRLLGLLSRCAYESVRRTWVAGFGEPRAVPGMVSSIQTFGSYANFHPHIHALVTNGVVTWQGEWLPLPEWTPGVIEEVFRRLVLRELVKAQRLLEEFREVLLTWERTGFSVYGEHVVVEGEEQHLERLVRYMVRPPMAVGIVEKTEAGNVRLQTPVDPRTGARGMELDPLEWIHALARQVPDPRQHLVRYYGLYANRSRAQWRSRWQGARSWSGSGVAPGAGSASGELGPALTADPRGGPPRVSALRRADAGDLGDHGTTGGRPDPRPPAPRGPGPVPGAGATGAGRTVVVMTPRPETTPTSPASTCGRTGTGRCVLRAHEARRIES